MCFLRRVSGISLRDRVRSSVICEGLGVEPLLLCVERSQLRWFGHLVRIPPHDQLGGDHGEDPGLGGEIISLLWPGNASGSPSQSWLMWPGKEKFGVPWWSCCPPDQIPDKRLKMSE